ncbi:hypothetical protein TRP8649_01950 [Pelagimonas phthalicica]|uniref:Uncharacterized protein n=1 Tax=Pelagimonas phthalicica TaxID=1037362 RepID=A0A238JAX1_9RHOB|nr:hypothetical protein [Pelagimonas phthalicica]TDS93639.1 hypothetical protein CLV87_0123 [Pelagimonas phthalicica]SMX27840.1 hypothetical protein TRP8649_01950 [Pelagimonas phthalicica]
MIRLGAFLLICTTNAVIADQNSIWSVTPRNTLVNCAAHFEARAIWRETLTGARDAHAIMMRARANRLIDEMHSAAKPIAPRMPGQTMPLNSLPKNHELKARVESWLVVFANHGHLHPCMEDPACTKCNTVFNWPSLAY